MVKGKLLVIHHIHILHETNGTIISEQLYFELELLTFQLINLPYTDYM